MPELPEVQTIVNELNRKVLKRTFLDIWTDTPELFKKPRNIALFKKKILGKRINNIFRKGKQIVFELTDNKILLIHQKMTGHFLIGKWKQKDGVWQAQSGTFLKDPANRFVHVIFYLNKDIQLAFSDLRKFAKIELWDKKDLEKNPNFKKIGPDSLEINFKDFKKLISIQKRKIKQVLMDQEIISGIGNIYSDEILFAARISPLRLTNNLKEKDLKAIHKAIKKILRKAIRAGGDSVSDYRRTDGSPGRFDKLSKVYRKEGEKCPICKNIIQRRKVGGRSAHFCSQCQK